MVYGNGSASGRQITQIQDKQGGAFSIEATSTNSTKGLRICTHCRDAVFFHKRSVCPRGRHT